MFRVSLVLCVFLVCALPVLADKPVVEYGNLEDLKDVKKIFIDTGKDMNLRDEIGAEIRKTLRDMKVTGRPEDSDIHLRFSYQVGATHGSGYPPQVIKTPEASVVKILGRDRERVLMTVKWPQAGPRIRIGWSRKSRPDLDFAREFVKAYKEANVSPQPRVKAEGGQKPVQLERTWDGEVKIELKSDAPADGCLVSQEKWNKLWKAYRGNEETPNVDFANELVLVAVNKDPNRISIQATLDANGDLSVTYRTTLMAVMNPTTCRYQFAVIKREGIKTINGKPIRKD